MPLSGFATPNGTAAYRNRTGHPAAYRPVLGGWMSSIGHGTYLGLPSDATDRAYREALRRALQMGIHVVDTAVNYRNQRSERVIGEVLSELIADGTLRRDEVWIATKGGYIPPEPDGSPCRPLLSVLRSYDIAHGIHAMSPAYIRASLARSRENLNLETIDVFYIHNPEHQREAFGPREFERRFRTLIPTLEEAVAQGHIRWYGIATWHGFRVEPDHPAYLSLATLLVWVEAEAGPHHHFRFIQLPVNLLFREAFEKTNQVLENRWKTLLEVAQERALIVWASSALMQRQVLQRLRHTAVKVDERFYTPAQAAIAAVRAIPGVTLALVGMRQLSHVEENGRLMAEPVWSLSSVQTVLKLLENA